MPHRRDFLRAGLGAAAALALPRVSPAGAWRRAHRSSVAEALAAGDAGTLELRRARSAPRLSGAHTAVPTLAERFPDLRRRFVFEYYPWYEGAPDWRHWDQWERRPPEDIAANYVPRLGPYDSRDRRVLEQHARWIADSGVGAINLSWWGQDSAEDRAVPLILDVMRDHGLKVTFHLEPYADDHGRRFAADVLYLLQQYGDRRRWDALLLLEGEGGGTVGPVFKGFRTILPPEVVDCHDVTHEVGDYTDDDTYARQFEALRRLLRGEFDRITLLADSLDCIRAVRAGFDGIAIYDNFVPPAAYAAAAGRATESGLLFSFNINPGYDTIEPREVPPGSCYEPAPFVPQADALDWRFEDERERAARLSAARITESATATLAVQTDRALANAPSGFFLVYVNSFNEWHEGHAFEPMKDGAALTEEERRFGYHNPRAGDYRLQHLAETLRPLFAPIGTANVQA